MPRRKKYRTYKLGLFLVIAMLCNTIYANSNERRVTTSDSKIDKRVNNENAEKNKMENNKDEDILSAIRADRYNVLDFTPPTEDEIKKGIGWVKFPSNLHIPEEYKKYIYTNNDEFWKEGNHIPDAGYLEMMKNPTPNNARLLILRNIIKRNAMHYAYQLIYQENLNLIKSGIIPDDHKFMNGSTIDVNTGTWIPNYKSPLETNIKAKPNSKLTKKHPQVIGKLFYHSKCRYCRETANNIASLKNVIAIQIDKNNKLKIFKGYEKRSRYISNSERDEYIPECFGKKNGKEKCQVPVTYVENEANNKIIRLKGNSSLQKVKRAFKYVQ